MGAPLGNHNAQKHGLTPRRKSSQDFEIELNALRYYYNRVVEQNLHATDPDILASVLNRLTVASLGMARLARAAFFAAPPDDDLLDDYRHCRSILLDLTDSRLSEPLKLEDYEFIAGLRRAEAELPGPSEPQPVVLYRVYPSIQSQDETLPAPPPAPPDPSKYYFDDVYKNSLPPSPEPEFQFRDPLDPTDPFSVNFLPKKSKETASPSPESCTGGPWAALPSEHTPEIPRTESSLASEPDPLSGRGDSRVAPTGK